jgi:hypothetical protein
MYFTVCMRVCPSLTSQWQLMCVCVCVCVGLLVGGGTALSLSLLTSLCRHRAGSDGRKKSIKYREPSASAAASLLSAEWKLKRSSSSERFPLRLMAKWAKRGCGKKQPILFQKIVFILCVCGSCWESALHAQKWHEDFQFFLAIYFLFFQWVSLFKLAFALSLSCRRVTFLMDFAAAAVAEGGCSLD